MTAEVIVEGLINNATAQANAASSKAQQFADAAQTAAFVLLNLTSPGTPTKPDVIIPPFDPTIDFTGDFNRAYNEAIADYDPDFQREVTAFINRFFPNVSACLQTAVDNWICDTINDGGTGIPANVENAIWQRDREREILESRRAEDEAVRGYSARGWMLPSGVIVDTLNRVREVLGDKISASSRDRAIKQSEIEIENIRFAVDQGVKLRLGAIDALVGFLGIHARMKELAIDRAKALVDAKIRLFNSVGEYYSAIIGAAQLMLNFDELKINSTLKQQEIFVSGLTQNVRSRVEAAISAAQAMGAIASSALSSQNSVAELSNATIESA